MDDDKLLSGDKADDEEASLEKSLRPQTLAQYIGQARVKHELECILKRPASVRNPWITFCCMVHRD